LKNNRIGFYSILTSKEMLHVHKAMHGQKKENQQKHFFDDMNLRRNNVYMQQNILD